MVHLHVRRNRRTPLTVRRAIRGRLIRATEERCDVLIQVSTGGAVGMSIDERCGPHPDRRPAPRHGHAHDREREFWRRRLPEHAPDGARDRTRIRALGAEGRGGVLRRGMMDEALFVAKQGLLDLPAHYDFVLGTPARWRPPRERSSFWSRGCRRLELDVAGIGRHQLPMAELGIAWGGNARVGLEDNIHLSKGVLAKGSHELVAAVAAKALDQGRSLATPQDARAILRLNGALQPASSSAI